MDEEQLNEWINRLNGIGNNAWGNRHDTHSPATISLFNHGNYGYLLVGDICGYYPERVNSYCHFQIWQRDNNESTFLRVYILDADEEGRCIRERSGYYHREFLQAHHDLEELKDFLHEICLRLQNGREIQNN